MMAGVAKPRLATTTKGGRLASTALKINGRHIVRGYLLIVKKEARNCPEPPFLHFRGLHYLCKFLRRGEDILGVVVDVIYTSNLVGNLFFVVTNKGNALVCG